MKHLLHTLGISFLLYIGITITILDIKNGPHHSILDIGMIGSTMITGAVWWLVELATSKKD